MVSSEKPNRFAANIARRTLELGYWTAAWVLTMALATFGPTAWWPGNDVLSWTAILANLAIGAGMIRANKRHLDSLDEMQSKVQLDAMALALGVGLVGGLGYSNLDIANLIPGDAEISMLVIFIGLTYLGGVMFGMRRYR
ncbi:MAG: hypothetical protein KDI19_02725 [Pseudomonadales bacterium]|nr:hypothetical protein [Pseudomonadales bacterium]